MPTELQLRAAEAWRLMTRVPSILDSITGAEAMPHGAALDYCQDVAPGNDRDEAVTALVNAGADWLGMQGVRNSTSEIHVPCLGDRTSICDYLRGEAFGMAIIFIGHIRGRCNSALNLLVLAGQVNLLAADEWNRWADKAQITIGHCRAVVNAAYPIEAESQS